MVHYNYGAPTDSIVYQKPKQWYPTRNVKIGGAPQRSGGSQTTFNITNNYGPPKGIMIANTVIGGLGMLGNLVLGFMGFKKQQNVQQQPQSSPFAQISQSQQEIDALKKQIEAQNKQIEDLKKSIEAKPAPEPEKKDLVKEATVGEENDHQGVDDAQAHKKANNNSKTDNTQKAENSQKAQQKQWTDEEKAKPRRLNVTFALTTSTYAGTATVVTPDGKTYKVQTGMSATRDNALNDLGNRLQQALRAAGWTNVTLESQNFNWSSDGSKAAGKVEKPNGGKQWTPKDKAGYNKPMTISFAVRSGGGVGNSGSATVTTPDGQLHQVTTGVSLTAARARKDLAKQMIELLHNRGWSNVQLQNNNFNDWQ